MNILAFDTCFDACSVAVRRSDTGEISSERELMRRGHAEALLPMIQRVMRTAGLAFAELDRIAVTHGPGTFTGSRVGVSAALGFAFAQGRPVVGYSSLECIARAAAALPEFTLDGYDGIVVARDARRASVYLEITDRHGMSLAPPALLPVSEISSICRDGRYLAIGSGAPLIAASWLTALAPDALSHDVDEPDARFMLQDAATRAPTEPLLPLYLRPPDATPSSVPPLARLVAPGPASGPVDV